MTRVVRIFATVMLLSLSFFALVYAGLPYEPLRLTASRLNSYLYGELLKADFEASPTIGIAPLVVEFKNNSFGDFTSSLWDFGDGSTSTLTDPIHIYTQSGSYSVTLTISGQAGSNTITRSEYITVLDSVVADFRARPTRGLAPLKVHFTNESIGDYDTCFWDFGDGSSSNDCHKPKHTYETVGAYDVSLTVSGKGGEDTLTKTDFITVSEPVEADFTAEPTEVIAPGLVQFHNESTGDFDSCTWDFGDKESSDDCDNPVHIYQQKGNYTVKLTVSGPGGTHKLTRKNYIDVYEPVSSDFSASPTAGPSPLDVKFVNESSGDFDTCTWDFGDGNSIDDCDKPRHVYETIGDYSVSLTISGNGGEDTLTKTDFISVSEPVEADFTAEPTEVIVPGIVYFHNESTGDFDSCTWDFGDKESSNDCDDPVVHIYQKKGSYTVSLTVSGSGGTSTLTRKNYITVLKPDRSNDIASIPDLVPLTTQSVISASNNFESCEWVDGDESAFFDCLDTGKPVEIPTNLKRTVCLSLLLRHR